MSDDTKITLLPAARLAEIRERDKRFGDGEIEQAQDIAEDRAELLAHLDALTAPAPADGGEALGRGLFFALHPGGDLVWKHYEDESKAPWIAAALALDAHGYARGFAAGADLANETTRHLIEARDLAQRTAEAAHAEVARLTAELAAERQKHAEAVAEAKAICAKTCEERDAVLSMHLEAKEKARIEGARVERERIETAIVDMLDDEPTDEAQDAIWQDAICQALAIVRNAEGDLSPAEHAREAARARGEGSPT